MLEIYLGCLIGGVLFAMITLLFGDILGDLFDGLLDGIFDSVGSNHLDFLEPTVIVGGITIFGGAGIVLTNYTSLEPFQIIWFSLIAAVLASIVVYFVYVRPMKNSENSTGFFLQDLVGKLGTVTVPIPPKGYGEVLIRIGAGNTSQIAASFDGEEIPIGIRVVVADVKQGTLYVFRYEDN